MKKAKKSSTDARITVGIGNVFADLRLPDAQTRLAKAELASRIIQLINDESLTQSEAAARLGVDQPKISALKRGHLDAFSTDRLLRFLVALGQDVQIIVSKPPARSAKRRGAISVSSRAA